MSLPTRHALPLVLCPIANACYDWWSKRYGSGPTRSSSSIPSPSLTTTRGQVISCVRGVTMAEMRTARDCWPDAARHLSLPYGGTNTAGTSQGSDLNPGLKVPKASPSGAGSVKEPTGGCRPDPLAGTAIAGPVSRTRGRGANALYKLGCSAMGVGRRGPPEHDGLQARRRRKGTPAANAAALSCLIGIGIAERRGLSPAIDVSVDAGGRRQGRRRRSESISRRACFARASGAARVEKP
jgi:hypothetical protein